jgi:hypothetical protein
MRLLSAPVLLAALLPLLRAADLPPGADPANALLQLGCLDVTAAPYRADPTGRTDATAAIQRAVNDARDHGLVCFFPEGTYLVSDTISCEQQVRKLDQPRNADGTTQHYWDLPHRIVLFGSTQGKRPVLKLAPGARGFADPAKPKILVHIWAQTRNDAPGQPEPRWGEEQPNISFSHFFRGIDLDIRGHPGAIGLRHAGSQGSSMFDSTILAEGAYAGLSNCCGQGGGTYNIEVIGGRHAITLDRSSRFPILTGCVFRGQTGAAITYHTTTQVPTMLVGCRIESDADAAIDLSTQSSYAGLSLIDCAITLKPGGVLVRTQRPENLFLENTHVRGATAVQPGGAPLPATDKWIHLRRYSSHLAGAVNLVNGRAAPGEIHDCVVATAAPDFAELRARHFRRLPSFEDPDAVNVKTLGAKGDGTTDDTAAFTRALAAHDKIFLPKGHYLVNGTLPLRARTQIFGLTGTYSSLGSGESNMRGGGNTPPGGRGRGGAGAKGGPSQRDESPGFTLAMPDDPVAAPGLSLLSVRGRVDWRSGQGTLFLARAKLALSGHAGGRFYGVMGMGRPFILSGLKQPTAFYSLNVERVFANPQAEFRDCAHLRIYYFKVEAGTVRSDNAGDGNTPGRLTRCVDTRIYTMVGNVRHLGELPMLEIVDSRDVLVAQLKAFAPSTFPHLTERRGAEKHTVPSRQPVALFVRD